MRNIEHALMDGIEDVFGALSTDLLRQLCGANERASRDGIIIPGSPEDCYRDLIAAGVPHGTAAGLLGAVFWSPATAIFHDLNDTIMTTVLPAAGGEVMSRELD